MLLFDKIKPIIKENDMALLMMVNIGFYCSEKANEERKVCFELCNEVVGIFYSRGFRKLKLKLPIKFNCRVNFELKRSSCLLPY